MNEKKNKHQKIILVCAHKIKWIEHAQYIGMRSWTTNVYTYIYIDIRSHTHKLSRTHRKSSDQLKYDFLYATWNSSTSFSQQNIHVFSKPHFYLKNFFFLLSFLFVRLKSNCMQNFWSFLSYSVFFRIAF